MTVETFDTPGPGTWQCPPGVTEVVVEVWAGGGGGGDNGGTYSGPGGGGGAYARSTLAVVPDTVYPYTVGAGGSPLNDGGESNFGAPALVKADPGVTGGTGLGQGGQALFSVGDVTFSGGDAGTVPLLAGQGGSGGGSSAGTASDGNPGVNVTDGDGTAGGAAVAGGGAGGSGGWQAPATAPADGEQPGGGAGGSIVGGATASGAAGRVRLTYGAPGPEWPDWFASLNAGGSAMKQTAAALSAWLSAIIATGKTYDPAATYVGVATAVDDKGQATAMADVTEATGDSATRVLVTAWSAPYPMADGRWAVDGPIAAFQQGTSDDNQVINTWFLASAASAGTLKAWGAVTPARELLPDGAPLSIVVRLTIDPEGRFDAAIVWNG